MTPDLTKKIKALKDPKPIWLAVGTQLVSLTRRSFRDPSLRPAPWKAKRDGTPSNLIFKGLLMSSIRITNVTRNGVSIGSDRQYAAIHQLGGVIRAKGKALVFKIGGRTIFAKQVTIHARPFFPFQPNGDLASGAVEPVREIIDVACRKALDI